MECNLFGFEPIPSKDEKDYEYYLDFIFFLEVFCIVNYCLTYQINFTCNSYIM